MAAVAAEPPSTITTIRTTVALDEARSETLADTDSGAKDRRNTETVLEDVEEDEEGRKRNSSESTRPESEDAGDGRARASARASAEEREAREEEKMPADEELLLECPLSATSSERADVSCSSVTAVYQRREPTDSQPSAVFLHSFPARLPATEAGLSLAEPAEPTTNVTANECRRAGLTRSEPRRIQDADGRAAQAEANPSRGRARGDEVFAAAALGSVVKNEDTGAAGAGTAGIAAARPTPGSEVRVAVDHVIDDALVVSFRVGDAVFSGVLMDLSKRFGPYGIPVTVLPNRLQRERPQQTMQAQSPPPFQQQNDASSLKMPASDGLPRPQQLKQENEAEIPARVGGCPTPWGPKPPPLFQEGAPYPPPLFIRDTYNLSLPQPPPRRIRRPKKRYRGEEPTSIMNAIRLRPRPVLCDKCKGVVSQGAYGCSSSPSLIHLDGRIEDGRRRRRGERSNSPAAAGKRLRSESSTKSSGNRSATTEHPPPSSSTSRTTRGMSSSSSSPSTSRLKLNSKRSSLRNRKAGSGNTTTEHSKLAACCVLKTLGLPADRTRQRGSNGSQATPTARSSAGTVTRSAALLQATSEATFTRRLRQVHVLANNSYRLNRGYAAAPLPSRVRPPPQQRYRIDEAAGHVPPPLHPSPSKHFAPSTAPAPCPSKTPNVPVSSSFSSHPVKMQECLTWGDGLSEESKEREKGVGDDGEVGQDDILAKVPSPPPSSLQPEAERAKLSLWPSSSSAEALDFPPPGEPISSSSSSSSTSSSPAPPGSSHSSSCSGDIQPPPTRDEEEDALCEEGDEDQQVEVAEPPPSHCCPSVSSPPKPVSRMSVPSTADGRGVCVGDIVWAKIHGFPWWPARVSAITAAGGDSSGRHRQRDERSPRQRRPPEARVSWFGSPTASHLPVAQLAPFLEGFRTRFDGKRKRGPYRRAVAEAARAAKQLTPEVRALLTQFET